MTTNASYPSPPHTRVARSSIYANRYVPEDYHLPTPEETPSTQGYPYAYGKPVPPEFAAPMNRRVSYVPAPDPQTPANAVHNYLPSPSTHVQAHAGAVVRPETSAEIVEPKQHNVSPTHSRRSHESRRSHRSQKSQRSSRFSTEEKDYERRHRDHDDKDRKYRHDKHHNQRSKEDDIRRPTSFGDTLVTVWDGMKSVLGSKHKH